MRNKKSSFFIIMLISLIPAVSVYGIYKLFPVRTKKENVWGIGIYKGSSPLQIHPVDSIVCPVIKASDVTDVKASFVADPFLIKKDSVWYMFFEVFNTETGQGDIGCASSYDGKNWNYLKIVIDEKYHISYPFVFEYNKQIYLIPESAEGRKLCLYRAVEFPFKWENCSTLLHGRFGDHALIRYNDIWWLFAGSEPKKHNSLKLFYSDDLFGEWKEHPMSPVVKNDARKARPGGRFLFVDGKLIRFTQNCSPTYGRELLAYQITRLTESDYSEQKLTNNPVLKNSGTGWNRHGMHHMDAH
ncbi:MAG: arabinan endo-1,5-alpha-L-arabinosidase, partial [Fibrobacter sp.]|nr:arabinan endo-1,5-alpha-L-arabinosidase [Fibrobacter sp.]